LERATPPKQEGAMAKRLSQYFGVPAETLKKNGVFNGYIGIDSKLFIDPNLLKTAKTPEFADGRDVIEKYFANVIKLLGLSSTRGDVAWREAANRLLFREQSGIALGYANVNSNGSGIGPSLAARLTERAAEIINLGVKDPVIFELIGLFEDDFGADRLSDMAVAILVEHFVAYSERIAEELDLKPRKRHGQ
jgi:hypothetical protein